jgi:hypothetical protein
MLNHVIELFYFKIGYWCIIIIIIICDAVFTRNYNICMFLSLGVFQSLALQ